jgi:hypothetical protein
MAVAVDSPVALVIVGVPVLALCGAIAMNVAGFGERAWVSSTWAKRGSSFRSFRIGIGGFGALVALLGIVAGIALSIL